MRKQQQKTIKRMPAKQTYIFQINIQFFFLLMSVYIKKISQSETNRFGKYCRLQNTGSEWLRAFYGISAQIKSSDEYLHPENQSQVSMSTDTKQYRILKSNWQTIAIWCFNSRMSRVVLNSKDGLKRYQCQQIPKDTEY